MGTRYACLLRPPTQHGSLPRGIKWTLIERGRHDCAPLRTDLPLGQEPHGVIEVEHPLTADEIDRHDLRAL